RPMPRQERQAVFIAGLRKWRRERTLSSAAGSARRTGYLERAARTPSAGAMNGVVGLPRQEGGPEPGWRGIKGAHQGDTVLRARQIARLEQAQLLRAPGRQGFGRIPVGFVGGRIRDEHGHSRKR